VTRILLLGLDPETVDFSDPALPPGMTAEKVRAGIAVALKQFTDRGWESDVGFIRPDETAGPAVERQLRSSNYDCVVIGGGVRLPPRNLALFEVVINAIRKAAPGATIAFNTRPDDSADAAARWVTAGSRARKEPMLDSELKEEMLVLVDKDGSLQPAKVIGPTKLLTPGPPPKITGWKLHVGPSALDYSTTADKIYPRE
jgi:hypothetical protein